MPAIQNKKTSTHYPIVLIFSFTVSLLSPILMGTGIAATINSNPLLKMTDNPLPGNATRLDYTTIDQENRRLLIAHLGDSSLLVFDLVHRKVIREIHKIPKIHGVIAVPEKNAIFATATGVDRLVQINSKTFRITRSFPSGHHPDGLAFDPLNNRVFISDETGHAITAIEVGSRKKVSTLSLSGEVGNTRYDKINNQVYSTVSGEEKDFVVAIDPQTMKIIRKIPVEGDCKPHGERISPDGKQLFILCQEKATLLIIDLPSGKIKYRFPVGTDPDVLSLDFKRGYLITASESGTVSVFKRESGIWKKIGDQYIAYRAHVVAIDPETGLVYLPLQDIKGKPVLRIMKIKGS